MGSILVDSKKSIFALFLSKLVGVIVRRREVGSLYIEYGEVGSPQSLYKENSGAMTDLIIRVVNISRSL